VSPLNKLARTLAPLLLAAALLTACSGGEKTPEAAETAAETPGDGGAALNPAEKGAAGRDTGQNMGADRTDTGNPEKESTPADPANIGWKIPTERPAPTARPAPTPWPSPTAPPPTARTPTPAPTPAPEPEPAPAPGGTDTQRGGGAPAKLPDICGRTPEVQTAIMQALAREGPRMSCQDINERETYRIRNIEVRSPSIDEDDLIGMPNLHTLSLDTQVGSLQDLGPENFRGMKSLGSLTLSLKHPRDRAAPHRNEQFTDGTFAGLGSLADLTVRFGNNSPGLVMTNTSLAGLDGLLRLDVDHIHAVDPGTLQNTGNLRSIRLTGQYSLEPNRQQTLPPDIFEFLPNLAIVEVQGLRIPRTLTLGSFEAACRARQWAPKDEHGETQTEIFVEKQKVELMKSADGEGKSGCLLRIGGSRIIEIP
jgi:hypothetical protein